MVAISIYRGNLHKVPDVPRKWLTPTPSISPKDFKILLHRRSKALARIQSHSTPKPNPNQEYQQQHSNEQDPKELDGGDLSVTPKAGLAVDVKPPVVPEIINSGSGDQLGNSADEITPIAFNPTSQMNTKEERKKEIEEKLKVLNARKHDLVQVLKQILNAEEELKRRSSMQGLAVRPPVSLQVDVTNDSGSMTRHLTPRMESDGFLRGDGEGGEADDALNHNTHSRNLLRMSSVSPSSDSPHKRPFHSAVPHASRANLWASASPSRFAPTGQQGNLGSVPTVSVSGTNYIASSPSPAASGGTSVFRDYLSKTLRLTFQEGVQMLKEAGVEVDPLRDLNTEAERRLGQLVFEKYWYKTQFYILHRYPLAVRPFYTMPCPDDSAYNNSFDVFIREDEIISGAQRVHVSEFLAERAEACGIDVKTISTYIDSFNGRQRLESVT